MPDLSTYSWAEIDTSASSPTPRVGATMVWAGDRIILFGGGFAYSPFTVYQDTWSFNTTTKVWTQLSPSTTPPTRRNAVGVWDPVAERVLMHGGFYRSGAWRVRLDTWQYEIGGDWTLLESAGPGEPDGSNNLSNHCNSGVWDTANDRFLFNLGSSTFSNGTNLLYKYDGSWTQLTPSPAMQLDVTSGSPDPDPQKIWGQGYAWDPVGEKMYLTCGSWGTDRSNACTWTYNGTGFTQIGGEGAGGTTPGIHRTLTSMVWAGDRGFLFGGTESTIGSLGQSPSSVNYSLSGTTWTLLSYATNPPARFGHSMVWNDECVFLFGGTSETGSGGSLLGDTWELCGEAAPAGVYLPATAIPIE